MAIHSMELASAALVMTRRPPADYASIGSGSTLDHLVAYRRAWCVIMRVVHGLHYGEIAAAGRCSIQTVRNAIAAIERGRRNEVGYEESTIALMIARDLGLPRKRALPVPDFDRLPSISTGAHPS